MKFKLPAFLENVNTPVEGEIAMRQFVANPASVGDAGSLDLFSSVCREGAVLVGVDEVGRGPLAGPVVACAAVTPLLMVVGSISARS